MSGVVAFGAAEFSFSETDGTGRVSIVRTGDLSQPMTVSYEIDPGNATPGADYVATSGQVTMAAGEDRAFIDVAIINDTLSEPTETMAFNITGVSSGSFGAPRTALVNILDDENRVLDPAEPPLRSDYVVTEEGRVSGLDRPIDFAFSPADPDIVFIAEKGGRIRVFDLGENAFRADFIDLSAQVNDWEDRGLMNIALHPDFPAQPYVYAFYVVDPPEAATSTGHAARDAGGSRYAYLSRFTADMSEGGLKAVPGSEVVLLGGEGESYLDLLGGGAIEARGRFNEGMTASDRLVDPADPNPPELVNGYKQDFIKVDSLTHAGGGMAFGPDGMLYVGIGDGTLPTIADPRTLSVQDLDSLSGKILRIDPITGDGLADNPFVEAGASLELNRSKVWQLGLRNPFSLGFHEDGRLFVTDTGWRTFEEINVGGAGANFGWPFFEGGDLGQNRQTPQYSLLPEAAAFYAAVASGEIQVTAAYRAFGHAQSAPGFQFQSIVGGDAFPKGTMYPVELRGDYFVIDFTDAEVFAVDAHDRRDVRFIYAPSDGGMPVFFSVGPDGYMWYADIASGEIGRIHIDAAPPGANRIALTAAKAVYPGTAAADVYVVDAANDSTAAARDTILDFDVAGGDRIDFTAMGWREDDISFTRHNVGKAGEFTRVNGPDGFSIRISETLADLDGGFIFASGANRAPVAVDDAAASTGGAVVVDVLANDTDADGDSLTIESFDTTSAQGGTITRSGSSLVYTPRAGFVGTDSFGYVVSDGSVGDAGLVTVTVTAPQTRLVDLTAAKAVYSGTAAADVYVVDAANDSTAAARDTILDFDVAGGDRIDFTAMGWREDDISFTRHSVGKAGEFTRVNGPDGFSIRISETLAGLDGGFIFASGANRAPVAVDDAATSTGGRIVIDVLANDTDADGDALVIQSFDATTAQGGTVTRSGAGLAYTPAAGFTGADSFSYVVSDGSAEDTGAVSVAVIAGQIIDLTRSKAVYPGTAGADIYRVDAANDSSANARDRIQGFDAASGDRIDFRPMEWTEDDISVLRFSIGRPGEFTRIEGPDGFSIRVDGPPSVFDGALLFFDDPSV